MVGQVKKSVVRRFHFPAQEHKFSTGGMACDPDTDKQWSVCEVDRALAIIMASPDLIRVSCRTPHQMVLANALCRAWETGG